MKSPRPTPAFLRVEETESYVLPGKRVVVCEDEGVTQMQIQRALRKAGMEVVGSAVTGMEALHTILQERPEIVIMDIGMPDLDGLEVAARIVPFSAACVVVLTAYSDDEHRQRALRSGASGYLVKPVTGEQLLRGIRDAWERYTSPEAMTSAAHGERPARPRSSSPQPAEPESPDA